MIKNPEQLLEEVENMPKEKFNEMMTSKITLTIRLSELMQISTALGTYLDTPDGWVENMLTKYSIEKLKDRLDSKGIIRLGTYGIEVEE